MMSSGTEPSGPMAELAARILAGGQIDADDVLSLRKGLYEDGVLNREEADLLFHLNENSAGNDGAWEDFFVEALSDYFLWRQDPPYELGEKDAAYLVERAARDGKIDDKTEFKLVVAIIYGAKICPNAVKVLALEALKESVLGGTEVVLGEGRRRAGVIDDADIEPIRRVVYGTGGESSHAIGADEAELLFALNDATTERENSSQWQEVFVKAITMFLLYGGGSPGRVDGDEAAWLRKRITQDGARHENETALLAYLKENAAALDASLDPLYET